MAGRAPHLLLLLSVCCALVGVLHPPRMGSAIHAAESEASLAKTVTFDLTVPAFSDADVESVSSTLASMLAARPADASSIDDARIWETARGLQTGRLSAAQQTRVDAMLVAAGRRAPASAALATRIRKMVDTLTVGKVAPEIVGRDLDGTPMKLSDYRGKVVALIFSGEWCGICRTQYPYERLLLELYKSWPFALVGVNSDADRDAAREGMADRGLTYRAWWDGDQPENTSGPIATNWAVSGWPTVYVIDGTGVIRFVDLRQEDLLKGVRQLLTATTAAASPASRTTPRTK
jgi:peroxiredoxin